MSPLSLPLVCLCLSVCLSGAREHPDEGAAFPDGGAEVTRAESGDGVLVRGRQPTRHQIRGYFAIPWRVGRGNFR